ncbi:MAG: extracellular solute-binding protein [Clostridia bacterium]|nr:extracellular solute-binding protein [Clostridia bacterium]
MKKTFPTILILLFVITLILGACTPKDPYIDDEKDDALLQIYLLSWSIDEKDVVHKYNREVAEGNIDGRRIEITEFEFEEIESMYDTISTEMMSGKGPDIIFVNKRFSQYLDLNKMSMQDAFADFDVLMEKSDTFSLDDYNKDALDTGIINEKRIMMPLSYQINYIVTTQENLDEIDISVPDYLEFQDFFEIMDRCHNNTDSVGAQYPSSQLFYQIISEDGLDTQGLDELEKCISLEIEDENRYNMLGNIGMGSAGFYQVVCSGDILMDYHWSGGGNIGEFNAVGSQYNVVENMYEKTFVLLNEPTINSEISYGYIDLGCVINMNSKHKNDAFKFVEFLLSEQCQYSDDFRISSFPVNIAAYESAKSDFENDIIGTDFTYKLPVTPLPDELKEEFINLVEGVSEYRYFGGERYILTHVVGDYIQDYMDKKIDFDTMVEEINKKIKLYYSE